MSEAVREMTFAEEAELYEKEARELFAKETPGYEAPPINSTVRRGMRIIGKARDEIQWLEKRMQWVSVEDRLPEPFVSVLVYMPEERPLPTVHEGFLAREGMWYANHFDREPMEITHWMPLPEPPKEEV